MERDRRSTMVAGLLIALGVLLLLDRAGWLSGVGGWLWGLIFLGGGLAFLAVFYRDRTRWWALFPGCGLLGLSAATLMDRSGGPLFLALLGLAFALVYAGDRSRWWAVIPAGALATLALVAWIDVRAPGYDTGWVFLVGMAATFAALAFQPEPMRKRWALYPALGLAALAAITLVSSDTAPIVISIGLIGVGGYLLWRRSEGPGALPRKRSGT